MVTWWLGPYVGQVMPEHWRVDSSVTAAEILGGRETIELHDGTCLEILDRWICGVGLALLCTRLVFSRTFSGPEAKYRARAGRHYV